MHKIVKEEIKVNVCTDIFEWAKVFYGMPEGAILQNEEEVSSECMGFASIDDKEISVFIPPDFKINDLKETVAHEIGHIIELKYPSNFEQTDDNEELHEVKADYYMNYYMLVDNIVNEILLYLTFSLLWTDVKKNINEYHFKNETKS